MKKYILTIFVFSTISIFSQGQDPSVELPDFVIFGKDDISVRKVEKIKPDYISTVSDEFLKPTYKPDYLDFVEISNPVESELLLLDSADYRRGFVELRAGRFQLPAGELNYTFPFTGGLVHGFVKGLNQLAYVDNSDKQSIQGSLDLAYTLPTNTDAMPGTQFSISGNHTKNLFKFFGSIDPDRKRNLNVGNTYIGVQNLYMKDFVFDLNGGADFTYLNEQNFNESILFTNLFGRLKLSNFSLGVKGSYQHQKLTTDSLSAQKSDAYYFRPTASLEIFNKVMLEAGFNFSASSGERLNGIYASISAEIAKHLTLFGEYSPIGENITAGKFLRNNFYYDQQDLKRVFLKKKNMIRATAKYEYDKYYQIDGGIEFYDADNLPYYNNRDSSGFFEVLLTDAVSWDFFLNMLYHLGPYGYFYASVNYLNIQDSDSRKIPYYPGLKASLIYGYHFSSHWKGEAKLSYLSDRYADIYNTESRKLKSILDFGLKITYSLQKNFGVFFEITNLFNTKWSVWEGYQEKPIDILLGINYLFD